MSVPRQREMPLAGDGPVAGVDEAGRGPLAGPVYAAAVILDLQHPIRGLGDSKTLTAARREALADSIRTRALSWAVAVATPDEIDALNILEASMLAMRRAIEALSVRPSHVRVDGNRCPELGAASSCTVEAIVRGDATCRAIGAASILAKVDRDAEMCRLHALYPDYGFDRHKGYPTPAHLAALERAGPSPVHRYTFAPVRAARRARRTS